MRDRIVGLERIKASELLRNPLNFRKHPRAQRAALKGSLADVGIAAALIARRTPDGPLLLDGHLRADMNPDEVLPVLMLDVTEAEANKLLASLDPIAAMATSNAEVLLELLGQIETAEEGLADLLENLRREAQDDIARLLVDPDDLPGSPEPRVKPGDLIELGRHRLICADARDPAALERLMQGDTGDLLLTDAPYGIGYVGKTAKAMRIANDAPEGLAELLDAAFAAAEDVLKPGSPFYLFGPSGAGSVVFGQAVLARGWQFRQTLVWCKDRAVIGHQDYAYQHEPIIAGYLPSSTRRGRGAGGFYGGNAQSSVIEVPSPRACTEHPTMKPVELLARLISNSTRRGGVVLDPFAGSGSTLVACEQLARVARLVEIDPAYCDVILARYERVSGEEVTR